MWAFLDPRSPAPSTVDPTTRRRRLLHYKGEPDDTIRLQPTRGFDRELVRLVRECLRFEPSERPSLVVLRGTVLRRMRRLGVGGVDFDAFAEVGGTTHVLQGLEDRYALGMRVPENLWHPVTASTDEMS